MATVINNPGEGNGVGVVVGVVLVVLAVVLFILFALPVLRGAVNDASDLNVNVPDQVDVNLQGQSGGGGGGTQ